MPWYVPVEAYMCVQKQKYELDLIEPMRSMVAVIRKQNTPEYVLPCFNELSVYAS